MSAAITAIVVSAAATMYASEQQRVAGSKADDKFRDEKRAIETEQAWQQKKKGINDKNASLAALRLRGEETTGAKTPPLAGATPPPAVGMLGSVGAPQDPSTKANAILNSPLGL